MRVMVALDTSDVGESAAMTIGRWAQSVGGVEVLLLSVVHPDEIHGHLERPTSSEFLAPADTEPGHIPAVAAGHYGGMPAAAGDPPPRTVELRGQALARVRAEREEYLREVATRAFRSAPAAVRVEFSERVEDVILEAATEWRADAIAMGTHGRTGLRHVLLGSVAERVMRQSPLPMIVVGPLARDYRQGAAAITGE